jgi:hypothetical protein
MTSVRRFNQVDRRADHPPPDTGPRREAWHALRDKVAAEHRGLESSDPQSPRIKVSLATAIGWVT